MDRIQIDADSLIMALNSDPVQESHFLDRETGEILFLSTGVYGDTDPEVEALLEEEPDRYVCVDPIGPSAGWDVMQTFVGQLPAGQARDELEYARHGRRPFRRFKDTLMDFPELRQQWFEFHDRQYREMAVSWLEDEVIEADLVAKFGAENEE